MSGTLEDAGGAIDAALVAREVERARVGAPAVGHDVHEPCANCGTMRQGPYCHACGQAGHVHRTAGALVHDIAHGVFHFEGRIWRTLPLLALKPGELTRRYVSGERAKFVSPMALFLFSVFLMFAIVAKLPGGTIGLPDAATPEARAEVRRQMAAERARIEARLVRLEQQKATAAGDAARKGRIDERIADLRSDLSALAVPQVIDGESKDVRIESGWTWLDAAVGQASKDPKLTLYKIKTYGYKFSWALIPISLPFLWLLFPLRRDIGLYDHAIFAIYSLSFMSLGVIGLSVLAWIGVSGGALLLVALIGAPLHMYKQLKGAYALGRFGALARTAALLVICFVAMSFFSAFLFWMGVD